MVQPLAGVNLRHSGVERHAEKAKLAKFLQDVRASYWFVPSGLVCLAIAVAQGMLALDGHAVLQSRLLPSVLRDTEPDGARTLMTTVAGSVFGVAGVMFSLTVVAVTFASGQFGPRLIRNFMQDRGNQWSMGILTATFVYALTVLRALPDAESGAGAVPHLSVTLALILTLVCVFTVIYFVHHVPETTNVSNIAARLGRRLIADVTRLIDERDSEADEEDRPIPGGTAQTPVLMSRPGYVQAQNKARLAELARENGLTVDLHFHPGDFVTSRSTLMTLHGPVPSEELASELRDCIALGDERTEHQNLLFVVDQLVEMIARALSPGVNDPFTANGCLDWLAAAVSVAAGHGGGLRLSAPGRVATAGLDFDMLLHQAFVTSRPYTTTDPLCDLHLRKLLHRLRDEIEVEPYAGQLRSCMARLDLAQPAGTADIGLDIVSANES
ncbi:MAG: DUF2254 domain-containing protein [Tabrizicola sp.]|nr:DUF2254 domain-containing protein [Tabrizicola sp.]